MLFADLALSRRLERAEGNAAAQFAVARRRLFPDSGAEYIESGGAYVVFDGVDSPVTQTFGLGIFEELTLNTLDAIEGFFRQRGAQVDHEISPFAGVAALDLLCRRNYTPLEISNVMCRPVERPIMGLPAGIRVRVVDREEAQIWIDVSARGWSHEHPELKDFLQQIGSISSSRAGSPCFLAELDGKPGAAGALCIHQGIALLGGAATIPELSPSRTPSRASRRAHALRRRPGLRCGNDRGSAGQRFASATPSAMASASPTHGPSGA